MDDFGATREDHIDCSSLARQYEDKCPCVPKAGVAFGRPLRIAHPSSTLLDNDSDQRVACYEYMQCVKQHKIERNSCGRSEGTGPPLHPLSP